MKTRHIICLALLMAMAGACKKNQEQDTSTFSASIEVDENNSKTYLDGMKVKWSAGDQIIVYGNGAPKTYTLQGNGGTQTGTFTTTGGVQQTDTYRAFYPAANCTGVSGDVFTFTMPATQTYTANGFMNNLNPMAAKTEGGGATLLKFKNAFSVLKVSATGNRTVTKVVLTVPSGNYVSGTYTFDYSTETTSLQSGNGNTIELTCSSGVVLDATTPKDFYFVLPPGTLPAGSTIAFYKSGSNTPFYTTGATTTAQTLTRNRIHTATLNAHETEKVVTNLLPELASDYTGWTIEHSGSSPYLNSNYPTQYGESFYPSGTYCYVLTASTDYAECFIKSANNISYTTGHQYYVRWMSRKEKWSNDGGSNWYSVNMNCFSQDVYWPAHENSRWVNSLASSSNFWEMNSTVFTHNGQGADPNTNTGSAKIRFDLNNGFGGTNFLFHYYCFADAMLIDLTACYADQGYSIPTKAQLDSKPYFFGQRVITDITGTSW